MGSCPARSVYLTVLLTDLNKAADFLLDHVCIYAIHAMFCYILSVRVYTNKILLKHAGIL